MEMRAFDDGTTETVGAVIADLRIRERDSLNDMKQLMQGLNPDETDDYVYEAKSKDHLQNVHILNEGVMKKGDKFQSLIKLQTLINSDLPL